MDKAGKKNRSRNAGALKAGTGFRGLPPPSRAAREISKTNSCRHPENYFNIGPALGKLWSRFAFFFFLSGIVHLLVSSRRRCVSYYQLGTHDQSRGFQPQICYSDIRPMCDVRRFSGFLCRLELPFHHVPLPMIDKRLNNNGQKHEQAQSIYRKELDTLGHIRGENTNHQQRREQNPTQGNNLEQTYWQTYWLDLKQRVISMDSLFYLGFFVVLVICLRGFWHGLDLYLGKNRRN